MQTNLHFFMEYFLNKASIAEIAFQIVSIGMTASERSDAFGALASAASARSGRGTCKGWA